MSKYNYDSIYKPLANSTVEWLPADTKELYHKNLNKNYNLLQENGWIGNTFTYKFNSYGFRCEEFTQNSNNIMFLGCSYTIGIGLPVEHTWPELVSKNLEMRCCNLGIGAGSTDTAFRLCHGYIDKLKPKIVIIMIPPEGRLELIYEDKIIQLYANKLYKDKDLFNFYMLWSKDDNNFYFNNEKNLLAIKMLCEQKGIKFVQAHHSELNTAEKSLARDLMHPGIKNHKLFSEKFITQI